MKLLGSIISGVGLLIAGTSGLCSLALFWMGFSEQGLKAFTNVMMPVLVFGGIPFAFGIALVLAGRALVREANSNAAKEKVRKFQEPREEEPTSPPSQKNQ